jgi:hypothetical protein
VQRRGGHTARRSLSATCSLAYCVATNTSTGPAFGGEQVAQQRRAARQLSTSMARWVMAGAAAASAAGASSTHRASCSTLRGQRPAPHRATWR